VTLQAIKAFLGNLWQSNSIDVRHAYDYRIQLYRLHGSYESAQFAKPKMQ
jgi:hypothetical protein